jgi:hypothetical protein
MSRESTQSTTVRISRYAYRLARIRAAEEDKSISNYIVGLIADDVHDTMSIEQIQRYEYEIDGKETNGSI